MRTALAILLAILTTHIWAVTPTPTPTATPYGTPTATPTPTSCVTGVTGYWTLNNTLANSYGSQPLVMNYNPSAIPLNVTTPPPFSPNTYWAGGPTVFNYQTYFSDPELGDVNTTQGRIEMAFNKPTYSGGIQDDGTLFSIGGLATTVWLTAYFYQGGIYFLQNYVGNILSYSSPPLIGGTAYYFIFNWNASGTNLYFGTSKGSLSEVATGVAISTDTVTSIVFAGADMGAYNGEFGPIVLGNINSTTATNLNICNPTITPTFTLSDTASFSPTNTPYAGTPTPTPWVTPTPAQTVAYCPAPWATPWPNYTPWPNEFVQNPTPILTASGTTYEQAFVGEPSVFLLPDNETWAMTYTANAFGQSGYQKVVAEATGTSPITCTNRLGVVMGSGCGSCGYGTSDDSAGTNTVRKVGGTYIMEFNGAQYATSTDGVTWAYQGTYMSDMIGSPPCATGGLSIDSGSTVVPYNGGYAQMMEALQQNCSGPPGIETYVLWLFTSPTNDQTAWSVGSPAPAYSITTSCNCGISGDLYAGPRALQYESNSETYHAWPHIGGGTNTSIYHTESYDLNNWKTDPIPVVTPAPTMFGLIGCTQAADSCFVEWEGNCYLIYDGTDNTLGAGAIGYNEFHGTFAQYAACTLATPVSGSQPSLWDLDLGHYQGSLP